MIAMTKQLAEALEALAKEHRSGVDLGLAVRAVRAAYRAAPPVTGKWRIREHMTLRNRGGDHPLDFYVRRDDGMRSIEFPVPTHDVALAYIDALNAADAAREEK